MADFCKTCNFYHPSKNEYADYGFCSYHKMGVNEYGHCKEFAEQDRAYLLRDYIFRKEKSISEEN